LDRDEAWVRWKENGCPPFEEPAWTEREFDLVEQRLRTIVAPLQPMRYSMGDAALSDLWKRAGDLSLESLRGRVSLPNPEDFLGEQLGKMELEGMSAQEQIEKIDEVASREWRGLRVAMKIDMARVLDNQGSLKKYIEATRGDKDVERTKVKKVGKEGNLEPMDIETKMSSS
jgi:hypothetical protein